MKKLKQPKWAKRKYPGPRVCADCQQGLPITDFTFRDNGKGIYPCSYCRYCMVKRSKVWQEKNYERYRAYLKAYYKTHYAKGN